MAHALRSPTLVQSPSRTIAIVLTLGAYAIALAAGLASGNDAGVVLGRALIVLVLAQLLSPLIARAAVIAIHEHMRDFLAQNPVPKLDEIKSRLAESPDADGSLYTEESQD